MGLRVRRPQPGGRRGHEHDGALELFGASIARQALEAGLLDEIVVHVAPILLGDGVRFYGDPPAPTLRLERTTTLEAGQLTSLRFRVRR